MPGFSDLGCLLLRSRGFLVPPHLRGLPLRLCSVAYLGQLAGEPVLLASPFPLYLGLQSEEWELLSDSASQIHDLFFFHKRALAHVSLRGSRKVPVSTAH